MMILRLQLILSRDGLSLTREEASLCCLQPRVVICQCSAIGEPVPRNGIEELCVCGGELGWQGGSLVSVEVLGAVGRYRPSAGIQECHKNDVIRHIQLQMTGMSGRGRGGRRGWGWGGGHRNLLHSFLSVFACPTEERLRKLDRNGTT
jgi:hypothetical protein